MTIAFDTARFSLGDVISLGAHPTVSRELVDKFWRVTAIEPGQISLDGPYEDKSCRVKYHSKFRRPT